MPLERVRIIHRPRREIVRRWWVIAWQDGSGGDAHGEGSRGPKITSHVLFCPSHRRRLRYSFISSVRDQSLSDSRSDKMDLESVFARVSKARGSPSRFLFNDPTCAMLRIDGLAKLRICYRARTEHLHRLRPGDLRGRGAQAVPALRVLSQSFRVNDSNEKFSRCYDSAAGGGRILALLSSVHGGSSARACRHTAASAHRLYVKPARHTWHLTSQRPLQSIPQKCTE